MNQFLCTAVLVLAFAIGKHVNAENLQPQIKATSVEFNSLNPKYLTHVRYAIEKHNATYNSIPMSWTFVRDITPTVVDVSVYVTDAKYENPKLILRKDVPICSENRYRELLPKPLVIPKTMLKDSCLKKGDVKSDDFGIFRFDALIPNIHEIGEYYIINYKYNFIGDNKDLIVDVSVYAEWGYLHTE